MTEQFYYPSFLHRDRLVHILDADAATCEALSVLFRLEGFQTTFATEAAGFLLAAERRPPDIALVNIRIGHEDGLAILRHFALNLLRQDRSVRGGVAVKRLRAALNETYLHSLLAHLSI